MTPATPAGVLSYRRLASGQLLEHGLTALIASIMNGDLKCVIDFIPDDVVRGLRR